MDTIPNEIDRHISEYKRHMDTLFEKSIGENSNVHSQRQHAIVQRIVDNLVKLKAAIKKEKDNTF